jgi:hypothetical protein
MKNLSAYALSWIGMVAIAILNGAIREKAYGPFMGELPAHQLSTFIIILLFGAYIWVLTGTYPIESPTQALIIGVMWLVMTVIFEFVFGHFVMGHPWSRLLQDYNLFKGRVWSLVLIWASVAPYLFYRIRSRTAAGMGSVSRSGRR